MPGRELAIAHAAGKRPWNWLDETRRRARAAAHETCELAAASPRQARLLRRAVGACPADAAEGDFVPAVDIPSAVVAAVRGGAGGAAELAGATLLMEAGIYLLDHLADAELGREWDGIHPALVHLTGTGLATTLPQLALAELDAPLELRLRLGRLTLYGLVRIAAGQQLDIEERSDPVPDLQRVEDNVAAKTGERRALYATLAATYAGAPRDTIASYSAALRAYGIARQLASDLYDVIGEESSRDLAAGARTWPVAWQLSRLAQSRRDSLVERLEAAKSGDPAAHRAVAAALLKGGAVARTLLEIERHCLRARAQLRDARPRPPGAEILQAMIDAVSPGARLD
jgi:hypothetical protein